jgi:hypothetical protein
MLAKISDIDFQTLGIIVSSTRVIIALCFNILNYRNAWLSNSAKMVLDLSAKFESAAMRKHRSAFAKQLLNDREGTNLMDDSPVLKFYEELGYMTRRGVLDKRMVWNSFFWLIEYYYAALIGPDEDLLAKVREQQKNQALYREFLWLQDSLQKVSTSEGEQDRYELPTTEEVEQALRHEAALVRE